MIINSKIKYYIFLSAKIAIALIAFYFIYKKISIQPIEKIMSKLSSIHFFRIDIILIVVFLSIVNWWAEIYKWYILSANFKVIDIYKSFKIVIKSFAISTITPNRIGEYGAKVMFYDKRYWKDVIGYNFFSNMVQLNTTILIGVITYFLIPDEIKGNIPFLYFILIFSSLCLLSIFIFKKEISISLPWISNNIDISIWRNINISDRLKVSALSITRYLSFSIQFIFLLSVIEQKNMIFLFPVISLHYVIVSIIPTILFADLLIRGSVSVFLFSLVGIDEITIITVVLSTWMFNFVLPTIIGSIFLLGKNNKQ